MAGLVSSSPASTSSTSSPASTRRRARMEPADPAPTTITSAFSVMVRPSSHVRLARDSGSERSGRTPSGPPRQAMSVAVSQVDHACDGAESSGRPVPDVPETARPARARAPQEDPDGHEALHRRGVDRLDRHDARSTRSTRPPAQVIDEVPTASRGDVDAAVAAARAALTDPAWAGLLPVQRAGLLFRLAGLMEEHHEELAQLETRDQGQPIGISRMVSVGRSCRARPLLRGLGHQDPGHARTRCRSPTRCTTRDASRSGSPR